MLLIIIYLLCAILVVNAIQVFQTAWVSDRSLWDSTIAIGALTVIVALVLAVLFALWGTSIAASVQQSLPPM